MKKTNNNKKINKNLTVRRNIITISASFVLMIVALVATIFVLNFKGYEKKFMAYDGYYDSQQVPDLINTTGKPAQTYQKMSELYNPTSFARNTTAIGNYGYISIETKDDFYAFTRLCTTNDFKTKKFILLKDIDWSSTDQQRLVTPISSFAGELNGNGYAVKNLTLSPINQDKLSDNYALFKELASGGKILNLGLVDTIMSINASPDSGKNIYLANLCAVNKGTIDHVYVKDHIDQKTKKTYDGMEVIISGFYISGVVAKNEGTFTNSYYAGKSIIKTNASLTITPNAIQEMLLENTGTQSNLYYYNESIESYTVNGSNISVKYSGVSQIYDYTSTSPRYGTYCKYIDNSTSTDYGLGEEVTSFSGSNWINESYYEHSNFGALIDFTTPLYKKIDDSDVSLTDGVHTVKITSTEDFNYIFNQMLINDKFTDKSMVYQLECDINVDDMANISYDDSIQSKFTVAQSSEENASASYHTIYMSKYYNVFTTDTGYKSYGFFPFFAGELSYINFVLDNNDSAVTIEDTDTTTKAIGSAIGYAEEAIIDHVNAYINVSFDNAIGKYLAGGIAGVIAGRTTISNSTANGSIKSTDNSRQSFNETAQNVDGVAIGGCVGYIGKTGASVDTLLSNVTITSQGYTGKNVNIGGVVAAGYFINSTKLQNNGSITIAKGSNNAAAAYGTLYAAGVVGRFLGMYSEATLFTNNGDMTLYQAPSSDTYYAGILNADIQKTNVGSYVLQSKGNNQFWAAAMTNGANINIYSANSSTIMYTYGINIKNSSQFVTTLSGIYNLNYKFATPSTALGTINIDMNIIKKFAPVIMSDNTGNSVYNISISTVYNLRNIEYKLNTAISAQTTFDYTGVVYGSYVNYTNVRNEGNQTITLGKGISTASTLYVSGVFKSLSNGCKATSIYNGGDILISEPSGSNAEKQLNMYLSGICYQNESVDSNVKQNPLSTTFDKSLVGTLNNTINSGNITVDSYYFDKTTQVNQTRTGNNKPYFNSNIYIGGITNINNGVISNTFNLGDINIPIYSYAAGKYYEAGGIAYMMDGQYAQIRDSANNGDITIVDTNKAKSYVNIGGIVARNTKTNTNNKQIISFTINYGTLLAFQAATNMNSSAIAVSGAHASAGGILGIGVCNLVNVVNYGSVYSNDCTAGIVSLVNLNSFSNANVINFANTINYGAVRINPLYYASGTTSEYYQTYNTIMSFEHLENGDASIKMTYSGAICTIFDFNSQNNVQIRYLINLCNDAATIMRSLNNPTTAVSTTTFMTSHGPADYFGTELIKYAPLSTLNDGENIGAFNENFIFYKAINGEGLDTEHYVTDLYISDFFEFVKFDKINPVLLDKLGWRTIAYANAAENLFKNIDALKTLVRLSRTSSSSTDSATLLSGAFTSNTWIESMNIDLLNSLLEKVLDSNNADGLNTYKAILQYVLLDSSANSAYTQQIRTTIINKIMDYYAEDANINYYELLQTLLYDELLAKVVSSNNADYAEVLKSIRKTLEDCDDLSTIFDAYITELQGNSNLLNDLFTNTNTKKYYLDSKIDLLQTLLSGYDEYTLQELLEKLLNGTEDIEVNYKLYLQDNPTQAKNVYIGLITYNAFDDALEGTTYLDWINEYTDKYKLSTVLDEEKTIDATYSKMVDNFGDITALNGYKYTALTGVQNSKEDSMTVNSQKKTIQNFVRKNATSLNLTPIKDYSALWNVIKYNSDIQQYISDNYFENITDPTSGVTYSGLYALATEWNNTYQSNDRSQLQYNIPITYNGGVSIGGKNGSDYYGNSFLNNYTLNGVTTSTSNIAIKTRYIYVPDEVVSYQTNYFGPFIDANGANKGKVYDAGGNLSQVNYNKGVIVNAAMKDTPSGSTLRSMIPVFIGLNRDFVVQKIAESNTTSDNYDTYVFLWNDCQNGTGNPDQGSDFMWKSESFISNKGSNSAPANNSTGYVYYKYDGQNIASDPANYIQYGYDFSPNREINKTNDIVNVTIPYDGGYKSVRGINDQGYKHTYSDAYLRSYVTASIITGVFMTHSTWEQNNGKHISLHSKNETAYAFNNYFGIHTTSYTGYKINDLVNLDGVRTKGHCIDDANNLDEDEINIVSAICTKLLSTDEGKEKVLYAIADYAKDHDYKTVDTKVIQMLFSAVQDTDFAVDIITKGIIDITDLKYDNTQTIGDYLDDIDAGVLSGTKDKIISNSVNNKDNFKTVLVETLSNYATKAKLYEDYYDYTRSAATEAIYDYVKYRIDHGEIDFNDLDAAIQNISDNDLTILRDLFTVSLTAVTLDNYTYQGDLMTFIIDNANLYNNNDPKYSTYDPNGLYSKVLVGVEDYDSTTGTGSYIEFTTGNVEYGYDFTILYDGTVHLVGNGTTLTASYTDTGAGPTSYTFSNLAKNTTYKLYIDEDSEFYQVVSLLSAAHTGNSHVDYNVATAPYASYVDSTALDYGRTFNLVTTGDDKIRLFGNVLKGLVNSDGDFYADANFSLLKGSNIHINSLNIEFKIASYLPENMSVLMYLNGSLITLSSTNLDGVIIKEKNNTESRNYTITQYNATIPTGSILASNTFKIVYYGEAAADGSSVILGDIYVNSNFDFYNSPDYLTNCVMNQNVIAPYADNTVNSIYSNNSRFGKLYLTSMTFTNTRHNLNIVVNEDGNSVGSHAFSANNSSYYLESSSGAILDKQISISPWYVDVSYAQGALFSDSLSINDIPMTGSSIVNNLNTYYNQLSDFGKYVIKDYFVKHRQGNTISISSDSRVEIYARGNGYINVYEYDEDCYSLNDYKNKTPYQTIPLHNVSTNRFFELFGNGTYVVTFTTFYTTDGTLYTYDSANDTYNSVTSGTYDSTQSYYVKSGDTYYEAFIDEASMMFTTDGTLYTYDSFEEEYVQVTSGVFDSSVTYYTFDGTDYNVVLVGDCNVIVDSIYTSTVSGNFVVNTNPSGINTIRYVINGERTIILQLDYSNLSTVNINNQHLSAYNTAFNKNYNKYELFLEIYPYYREVAGKTNEELYNNDVFETLITLMATIKQDSTNTNYFTLFADSCFTDEKLIELIKLIALADYNGNTSALGKLINTTYFNNYCDDLLNYFCDETTGLLEFKINVAKYIWEQADDDHSSTLADYIYGAYLGDDYLSNPNLKTETLMYTLLNKFTASGKSQGYYQFITTNTTVDSEKVAELITLLTSNSDFELGGYGIYALASSQGKLNGQFIPDNLELDTLDPYYAYVSESIGYALVSATSTSSATWRGGSSENEDDTTDSNSVNHAFYIEMRQLIKSISTTVFELTLVDNATGTVEYYGDVNLDARTVTFYVADTSDVFGSYRVSNIDLAYHAEAYDGAQPKYADDMTKFGVGTVINVSNPDVVSRQFTVFAEDTSVHKTYSIIFKVLKPSFDLVYKGETGDAAKTKTVGSAQTNTTVELSLTSKALNPNPSNYTDYLPIGLNLKPYIRLDKMDGTVVDTLYMDSEFIDLSTRSGDHIVKPVIVNHVITGSQATITMEISYKIPAGEYRITVSVCGYTDYVTYIKEASSQYTIEAHFGDSTTNIFASSKTATSYVQFGRLYNNIELTDFNDNYDDTQYGEFYLSYFSYSANATVKSTATKEVVPVYDTLMIDGTATQVLLYNKYRYTITYVIEAEDIAINTGHKATYTHYVEELDPYANNTQFGDVSKDGTEVNPGSPLYDQDAALDDNRVVSVKYQVGQLRTNNGDPVYKTEISKARVQFNRSEENGDLNEPRYSISYNMDNIYTISPNATLTPVEITADETIKGSATVKSRFGGMSIKLSYLTDTGVYEFKYVYANKGVWYTLDENNNLTYDEDNVVVSEEYTSTYDFPALQISKLFSLDATIHSITFMDAFQGTSAASTGVRIHAMRPTDDSLDTETGEMVYSDILDDTEGLYNDIAVQPNGDIVYNQKGTDYATVQYSDYYIVGAVSNAQLSNYAPTFTIEEHALIFQYITARISNNYGDGKQGNLTDAAVLEDHSTTTYLYVPFTHVVVANDTQTIVNDVFLVQLNGKRLTNVYIAKGFTTSSTSIATINVTINDAKNTGASFTYDGVTYTLNKAVFGEENNNYSLYMDYIGSPLNDHFWYVNYVVFSENYVRGSESIYLKYYHIAIIDRSNNVYFDVLVIVPVDFDISKYDTLYLLFQGTYKDGSVNPAVYSDLAVGAYVYEPDDYDLNGVAKKAYVLRYNIQMLPSAYYYFNIDLPVGYQAEATVTNKTNFNAVDDYLGGNTGQMNYEGAYLPPSSIVAQVVQVTINVTPGETGETNVWGITNSDVYTRRATLDNDNIVGN